MKQKANVILCLILYLLFLYIRYQQGGWEIKPNYLQGLRTSLDKKISQNLPSPQAELLSGIILGVKKDLPADFRIKLRDTSTLHIVVVSGQNLSMLAGMLLPLAGLMPRNLVILISISLIAFYTMLTGAQVPVLRASIMALISYVAIISGRQNLGWWALIVSGGAMLLINPEWIKDLSFQLSFLATFGIVMVSPVILNLFNRLPRFISQDLSVTIAAQLMVLPIIAQSFHQFSVISILVNMLVGWVVPIIMILGTISLITGSIFFQITNIFLTYFVIVVNFFGSLDIAWQYVGEKSLIFWIGYYFLVAGGYYMILYKYAKK